MNDNQEQEKSTVAENHVQNVEAEVIGTLRKDKIGKPILVVEIALLFALVFIALPLVNEQLNDPNSFLYTLIYGTAPTVTPTQTPTPEFSDGGVEQVLNAQTKMKKDNIVMENFSLSGDTLKCNIYSYNGVINLDEKQYYLELYSQNKKMLVAIKLKGTYDAVSTPVDLSINGFSFNSSYKYTGKIVLMNEELYPNITIPMDESGIGSLTCKLKDSRTITYTFKNYYLIKIEDEEIVKISDYEGVDYLNLKKNFETKKSNLGDIASVEETDIGFVFKASIDLEVPDYKIPSSVIDYNYYAKDKLAKEIDYALKGKGYDCK